MMTFKEFRKRFRSAFPWLLAAIGSFMGAVAWWIGYESNPIEFGTFLLATAACLILKNREDD